MDDRNFPWHLGFGNKFDARITNLGQMCEGFRLFPVTVFLAEYFRARFKEIPFWMKRAMILLFLFSLYFWIKALFHNASTFDPLGSFSRTAKKVSLLFCIRTWKEMWSMVRKKQDHLRWIQHRWSNNHFRIFLDQWSSRTRDQKFAMPSPPCFFLHFLGSFLFGYIGIE